MSDLLPFIVVGIVTGAVYGLTETGLVLTYKTSGIFNFAQGSIAALAAFAFYFLHVDHNWPWPLSTAVCLLVVGPVMGLALERLALVLADVNDTLKIASTIGIVLIVLSLGEIWFPSTPAFPSYLPTQTYRLFGVNVGSPAVATPMVDQDAGVEITAGLWRFSSWFGVQLRKIRRWKDTAHPPSILVWRGSPGRVAQ